MRKGVFARLFGLKMIDEELIDSRTMLEASCDDFIEGKRNPRENDLGTIFFPSISLIYLRRCRRVVQSTSTCSRSSNTSTGIDWSPNQREMSPAIDCFIGNLVDNREESERMTSTESLIFFWSTASDRENISVSDCTILFFLARAWREAEREQEWPLTTDTARDSIGGLCELVLGQHTCFRLDLTWRDRAKRDEQLRSQLQLATKSTNDARGLARWLQPNLLE